MRKQDNHWPYKLMLMLVAVIWGSGFVATDIAVDAGASPMLIMALRFLLASIFLTVVFHKHMKKINRYELIGGAIVGLFLFLGFAFQTYGIQFTTPSKNAFLTGVNVVIVPFIYWGIYRHKPRNQAFLAALLCMVGISLLTLQRNTQFNVGDGLSIVCAVFFAGHIVSNGYFLKKINPIKLTMLQMYITTILSIIGFIMVDDSVDVLSGLDMESLWAMMYLGIFCTCIAFLMQSIAQSKVNANNTAIVLSLESMFGTLLSVLIVKEVLSERAIYGSIMIFISIMVAEVDWRSLFKRDTRGNA